MNDFWEWMEKNEYGEREITGVRKYFWIHQQHKHGRGRSSIKATNQMLIGYMMEYLRRVKGKIILNTGGKASIEDVYDQYVKDIEKLERV